MLHCNQPSPLLPPLNINPLLSQDNLCQQDKLHWQMCPDLLMIQAPTFLLSTWESPQNMALASVGPVAKAEASNGPVAMPAGPQIRASTSVYAAITRQAVPAVCLNGITNIKAHLTPEVLTHNTHPSPCEATRTPHMQQPFQVAVPQQWLRSPRGADVHQGKTSTPHKNGGITPYSEYKLLCRRATALGARKGKALCRPCCQPASTH